jgi:hypothetical protein
VLFSGCVDTASSDVLALLTFAKSEGLEGWDAMSGRIPRGFCVVPQVEDSMAEGAFAGQGLDTCAAPPRGPQDRCSCSSADRHLNRFSVALQAALRDGS